ncbi:MAG TPA: hypothetical protein VE954_27165 [Oligoflexus sp.]|uniref:hypothetical protein n=1 Tax=Oligoflexus sp. TaxID=1971216 RepID=UPI002D71968A|nr:hypothetical protein [Oligoflexus sp.]HYX36805.1 hypothetical protein [Oligoflexus sp.]
MAEQWLSIVEYARTFAVSDMTVRRRIKTGRLQAVLKEGKYYIPVGPGTAAEAAEFAAAEARQSVEPAPVMPAPAPAPVPAPVIRDEAAMNAMQTPRPGATFRTLPGNLSNNLQKYDNTLVDSQALLQFCEHSVTRINSIERHLQESFQLRLQSMEAQLKLKDSQLSQLKQQVEDLQMLVKLMEMNGTR